MDGTFFQLKHLPEPLCWVHILLPQNKQFRLVLNDLYSSVKAGPIVTVWPLTSWRVGPQDSGNKELRSLTSTCAHIDCWMQRVGASRMKKVWNMYWVDVWGIQFREGNINPRHRLWEETLLKEQRFFWLLVYFCFSTFSLLLKFYSCPWQQLSMIQSQRVSINFLSYQSADKSQRHHLLFAP